MYFRQTLSISFFSSILLTTLFLHFFGEKSETTLRNFYRESICKCDTLRPKIIIDTIGIPSVNYYSVSGEHIGIQTNPLEICKYGLTYFESYQAGELSSKPKLLACSNWLIENSEQIDSFALYHYKYPKKAYNLTAGWLSAMTHGMAIQLLIHVYNETQDSIYLLKSEQILNTFFLPVDSGGITYKTENEGWWYEEYAQLGSTKPYVLMGMLDALLGIHIYYQKTHQKNAYFLFNKGMIALEKNLHKYHRENNFSMNDLVGHKAN